MDDRTIIKIVFGILFSIGAFVVVFIAFKSFYKYLVQEKRCTKKTKGVVKKYAQTPGNGIYLPKVYYTVDGKEYKVIGPRYRAYITKKTSSLTGKNVTDGFFEDEKQRFVVSWKVNSFVGFQENPMVKLYPIGSEIDVFYDPNNPKLSYVSRYCNLKWMFWFLFLSGIALILVNVLLLILL